MWYTLKNWYDNQANKRIKKYTKQWQRTLKLEPQIPIQRQVNVLFKIRLWKLHDIYLPLAILFGILWMFYLIVVRPYIINPLYAWSAGISFLFSTCAFVFVGCKQSPTQTERYNAALLKHLEISGITSLSELDTLLLRYEEYDENIFVKRDDIRRSRRSLFFSTLVTCCVATISNYDKVSPVLYELRNYSSLILIFLLTFAGVSIMHKSTFAFRYRFETILLNLKTLRADYFYKEQK